MGHLQEVKKQQI